ncbi:hypothetical protein [Oceanicoccus sp. KOV_DT_Chl]|uniref:hypothetical protein n=1 Tax=Oceanicoccus sp. KOV_DT_Chl TaxID=1904639 RepID=UPI000C7B73DE|nr:hypothetical protein [Oceanicoccus sp. KOV_DT_Chl]
MAKTYNEQLYCEIQASGIGSSLPSFNQFQNNTALTQSLLLKPYARKLGLTIKIPTKKTTPPVIARSHSAADNHDGLSDCSFHKAVISCNKKQYHFLGNQRNESLGAGVLDADNRMQLPAFDKGDVDSYLVKAYEHYLNKMIEIGLAGATLHYGNFEYIFYDLRAQDIDFTQRFETMYRYLKKDKRNINVMKSVAPSDLTAKECFLLNKFLVCSRGRYNYIYRA